MDIPDASSSGWTSKKIKRRTRAAATTPDVTPSNFTQLPLHTIHRPESQEERGVKKEEGVKEGFADDSNVLDTADPEQLVGVVLDYVAYAGNMLIAAPINAMNQGNTAAAGWIGAVFSGGTAKPADLARIESHFKYFIATIIACFAFYNWYFLIFYKENQQRIPVFDVSTGGINQISQVLGFLLKYLVCQVSFVQAGLLRVYPDFMNRIFGTKVNMMLLFFLVVFIVYRFGDELIHLLKIYTSEIASNDDTYNLRSPDYDYTRGIIIVYMLFFGLYSVFGESKMPFLQMVNLTFKSYAAIVTVFVFLLRVLFSSFFTWLAGMFVVGYLLIYSFAAILIYSKSGLVDTIKQINRYINTADGPDPFSPFSKYNDCNNRSWITWMLDMVKNLVLGIYRYMFELVFIYMFLQALLDYSDNIENVALKTCMMMMCFIGIFILGFVIYTRYRIRSMEGDPDLDPPVDPIFSEFNKAQKQEMDATTAAVDAEVNSKIEQFSEAITGVPGTVPATPIGIPGSLPGMALRSAGFKSAVQNVKNMIPGSSTGMALRSAGFKSAVQNVKNMIPGAPGLAAAGNMVKGMFKKR